MALHDVEFDAKKKMLTNGAFFSTFKHLDPHTVRSTLKDGAVSEYIPIRVVPRKQSNDLAKVLLETNQKSNGLSMHRKYGKRFTVDNRTTVTKVFRCCLKCIVTANSVKQQRCHEEEEEAKPWSQLAHSCRSLSRFM